MNSIRHHNSIADPAQRGNASHASRRARIARGVLVLLGVCTVAARGADDPPQRGPGAVRLGENLGASRSLQQLVEAGITPDSEGLADYLALYRVDAEQKQAYHALLHQLGDDDFFRREDALLQLLRRPLQVHDDLVTAVNSPDPEVRWRAEIVLEQSRQENHDLLYAALLVIRDRKIEGLASGVLATFPVCRHENRLRFAMGDAFSVTATAEDADLLRENLSSDDLNLRVMIATALGRTLGARANDDLRPLLDDPEDVVRVTAAESMVQDGDAQALRTLGKLLESRHLSIRNRSIQVLRSSLKASLSYSGYDPVAERGRNAAKWREAIEEHLRTGAGETPEGDKDGPRRRMLMCAPWRNQWLEVDDLGECIALDGTKDAIDCRLLPDGQRLLTLPVQRRVRQIDRAGHTVFEVDTGYLPVRAERLDNGNTVVVTGAGLMQEFDSAGALVHQSQFPGRLRDVRAAPDGQVLLVSFSPGHVIRLDRNRNEIWRSAELESPAAVCLADDGHLIVALSRSGAIVDVDPDGEVSTVTTGFNRPSDLRRLADDHFAVLDWTGLYAIDRHGKSFETLTTFGDIPLE